MLELIQDVFNRVYHEREQDNPDGVPANEITSKFIERATQLMKRFDDGRFKLFVRAGTNHSVVCTWRNVEYYIYYDYKNKCFKIEK